MAAPAPLLKPGVTLAGRYLLQRLAWESRLGEVWRARDSVLDRPVHVQVLAARHVENAQIRRAFRRASARAAQLTHPALLQVYDIGSDPDFVVFEAPGGGRLGDRLRAGALDVRQAAQIALALASGIEALHAQGSWHGFLTPDTVVLDEEGRPKTLGAGLADALAETARSTPPGYLPREKEPSPRDADQFALSALTYHMLTGRAPGSMPAPARSVRKAVPPALDALLTKALSPDPAERPALDRMIGAIGPFARPDPPDVKEPRWLEASEFRALAPAIFIVVLAVLAVVFGTRFEVGPRTVERPRATTPTVAPGTPLEIAAVTDFDPPPGDGRENPQRAAEAADGSPLSGWRTSGYRTEDLSGRKEGVGLLFDLGEPAAVSRIRVLSSLPGWQAEWRSANQPGGDASAFRRIATFEAAEERTVQLAEPVTARYFLLWITRLADDEGGSEFPYRAIVSEVEFLGSG